MVRGAVTEPLHRPKPTQSLVTLTSLPQSLSTSLTSLNRSLPKSHFKLAPLSQSFTTLPKKIHESMVSKERRVKTSPLAVTTAPMMLKSSLFASSIQVFFLPFLGLGFRGLFSI